MRSSLLMFFAVLFIAATAAAQTLPAAPVPQMQTEPLTTDSPPACAAAEHQSAGFIHAQQFASAIEAALKAKSACPDQIAPLLLLARAQMLSGTFADAKSTAQQVLAKSPQNLESLILLGKIEYLQDDDALAIDTFHRAIAAAPQSPEPHYWLGRLLYQDGAVPRAIIQFEAALTIDPANYNAEDALGLCYQAMGNNDAAEQSFLKAVALVYRSYPHYDRVYADYAELMLHLNDSKHAFDLAAEGADRNPANPREFLLAGKALQQAGDEKRSVDWLTRAAKLDPENPEPHYLLAQAYRRLGRQNDAKDEITLFKNLTAKAPKLRR